MNLLGVSLSFEDSGYLSHESVEELRRAQMAVKAVSAYEFALPINGLQRWHLGVLEDAEHGDRVLYESLAQKAPILTSNESTPYEFTYVDLSTSAYDVEIPAGHCCSTRNSALRPTLACWDRTRAVGAPTCSSARANQPPRIMMPIS